MAGGRDGRRGKAGAVRGRLVVAAAAVAAGRPRRQGSDWVRTPIDAFLLAAMEQKGLHPSPAADKTTLLRRVTFDLIGLPPTPEEIDAFLKDDSPDAYEKLVDRLLASPRYGERWGRHWLDVVHYGDTHGYDKDKRRDHAWPYRDYVIRAFNDDKPYGRFIKEQLAGDVLFPDDPRRRGGHGLRGGRAVGLRRPRRAARGHGGQGKDARPRPRRHGGQRRLDLRQPHRPLRPLPRSQVRPHPAERLLPPPGRLRRRRARRPAVRQQGFAGPPHGVGRPAEADRRRTGGAAEKGRGSRQPGPCPAGRRNCERPARNWPRCRSRPGAPARATAGTAAFRRLPTWTNGCRWISAASVPLDAVRLVPARPTDFPDTPGFGFPVRFRVEASDDPTFAHAATVADQTKEDFANPGDGPVVFQPAGLKARYVRVTAKRLWKRTGDYVFALAEMEVDSGGKNVARGAAVTSLDSIEAGRWSNRYLVDGYDSRAALPDLSDPKTPAPVRRRAELQEKIQTGGKRPRRGGRRPARRRHARRPRPDGGGPRRGGSRLQELARGNLTYAVVPIPPRPIYVLHRGDVEQNARLGDAGGAVLRQGTGSRTSTG